LNILDLSPDDLIADKLAFQLTQKIQAAMSIDQVRIGNRIGGASEEIGEADLIPDIRRHYGQRRIEQSGDLFEEIPKQLLFGKICARDHTYSTSKVPSIPFSR
jgi:hypothetical protein